VFSSSLCYDLGCEKTLSQQLSRFFPPTVASSTSLPKRKISLMYRIYVRSAARLKLRVYDRSLLLCHWISFTYTAFYRNCTIYTHRFIPTAICTIHTHPPLNRLTAPCRRDRQRDWSIISVSPSTLEYRPQRARLACRKGRRTG
jgi:hypothetical protein